MTRDAQTYLISQEHAAYTPDDHAVWREALGRHTALVARHRDRMHPAYLEGLQALQLSPRIPRIEELNERLAPTGWKTACVDGGVPTATLIDLQSSRTLPVARRIRRFEHIDHAPGPDIVHDVFGHLPMLFSPEYRVFLARIARAMATAAHSRFDDDLWAANRRLSELVSDPPPSPVELAEAQARVFRARQALAANPSERTHLARMLLWSVEFGLLGTVDDCMFLGAAILSSPAEFRALCTRAVRPSAYSMEVIHRDYAYTELQTVYYLARDFAQWLEVLDDYEASRHRGRIARQHEVCSVDTA